MKNAKKNMQHQKAGKFLSFSWSSTKQQDDMHKEITTGCTRLCGSSGVFVIGLMSSANGIVGMRAFVARTC